jgi:hypothetical protein
VRRVLEGLAQRAGTRRGTVVNGVKTSTKKDVTEQAPRTLELISPDAHRALVQHRENVQVPVHVEVKRPPKTSYEERKANFEKFYKNRPSTATFVHSASGETLWDVMYSLSTNRRWAAIPYASVIEYPTIVYPENDCLLVAVSEATGKPTEEVFFAALRAYPRNELNSSNLSLPLCLLHPIGLKFGVSFKVEDKKGNLIGMYGLKAARGEACFLVENGHISCVSKLSMLVITRGSIPLTISPKA